MAELTPLYMDISNVYSGDDLGLPWRDVIGEGVIGANDLKVSQNGAGADLSVDIAAGAGWVAGDTNPDAQPTYRVRNDAVVNLGISPDASNPRKVLVVAAITDETFSGTGRTWALEAIHGTPAPSPAEPALPDSALKLAVITVPAGATSIVTANITDSRVRAKVGDGTAGLDIYGTKTAAVSATGTTFAAGTDILATPLTFKADGVSSYEVRISAPNWFNSGAGQNQLRINLDGADVGVMGYLQIGAALLAPCDARGLIITPSAGLHTVNVRLVVNAGTGTVTGGPGGAGQNAPISVSVAKA